jgi:hypothetical protein
MQASMSAPLALFLRTLQKICFFLAARSRRADSLSMGTDNRPDFSSNGGYHVFVPDQNPAAPEASQTISFVPSHRGGHLGPDTRHAGLSNGK